MVSVVDICNRSIIKADGNLITALSQDSEEAINCTVLYPQLLDEVLRAHFWNFAIDQATLNQAVDAPLFGFAYKYLLPADYIRIYRMKESRAAYKIKSGYLHTDLSSVDIEYVRRETDTTKFDAMFVTAMTLRLGSELAYPIAGSAERAQQLLNEYTQFIKLAKRSDGQEGTPDSLTADAYVDSRHGNGGYNSNDWTSF